LLFCPVGTGSKQDRVLARVGLAAVPGQPLIAVPQFEDELRLMHVCPSRPPSHVRELVADMAILLKVQDTKGTGDDDASVELSELTVEGAGLWTTQRTPTAVAACQRR
jgi:hypothetical protein